jgi:DNA helicase-2/ATP-dependent DNA helicase PcrA
VGSLDKKPDSSIDEIDKVLQPHYRRILEEPRKKEPDNLVPLFDFIRLYYVAFSRAMNILVLTGNSLKISRSFQPLLESLPQLEEVQDALLTVEPFAEKIWPEIKPRYSFTGHIRVFERCPRQYEFYKEYQFVQTRQLDVFFGQLVHQTIEKIHRLVLDGKLATLTEEKIRDLFEQTFLFLSCTNLQSIDAQKKEKAFEAVTNYVAQNRLELQCVKQAEESISFVKDNYIFNGKIDLVMQRNGTLEILDFKTGRKPQEDSMLLDSYERQLYLYAYALEQRDKQPPRRLLLYWTEEGRKEDALMVFPYHPEKIVDSLERFEKTVGDIQNKQFQVRNPPEKHICQQCDIRSICIREGLIDP